MGPRRMPAAEVDVSVDLVQRLLTAQQPDLARLPLQVMANGWDNLMCRLGDQLVVRLPRRAIAAGLIVNEQRWLPVLAPRLPLPVPAPVRVGQPTADCPWSWSIVPFLPGQPAAATAPSDSHQAAVLLGRFVGALHTPAPETAPVNPVRGIPLAGRAEADMRNVSALGGLIDRDAVMRVWDAAVSAPRWDRPPVWLHGDLHPANILVSEGRVSAVIDFGDITSGDPAADLAITWMILPAECRDAFGDAYQEANGNQISADCWTRARGWALVLSLAFLAHSADNQTMADIGLRTLAAVLA